MNKGQENNKKFLILLAATPLTGTTVVENRGGRKKYSLNFLKMKIEFLSKKLDEYIDDELDYGIVLKTVYLKEDGEKLTLKTRCWYFQNDLYNVGSTPREMFSVQELGKFLNNFSDDPHPKLVLSFGIKSVDLSLWRKLFDIINCSFTGIEKIEINARHTIREFTKLYLGSEDLDEYMTPSNPESLWNSISSFFIEINRLGLEYKKKIYIKLPFRSDLLILSGFVNKILEENKKVHKSKYGLVGVTLINTIKSPYPATFNLTSQEHTKIQQMSGSSLRAIRNWSIKTVKDHFSKLSIWASGGIMNIEDILISRACGADGVQLGTFIILNGIEKIDELLKGYKNGKKKIKEYREVFKNKKIGTKTTELNTQYAQINENKCIRCGTCLKLEYCDAFENKYARFLTEEIIEKNGKKYYIPKKFLPKINPDYCSGCGLCMQMCPQGAIVMVEKSNRPGRPRILCRKIGKNEYYSP